MPDSLSNLSDADRKAAQAAGNAIADPLNPQDPKVIEAMRTLPLSLAEWIEVYKKTFDICDGQGRSSDAQTIRAIIAPEEKRRDRDESMDNNNPNYSGDTYDSILKESQVARITVLHTLSSEGIKNVQTAIRQTVPDWQREQYKSTLEMEMKLESQKAPAHVKQWELYALLGGVTQREINDLRSQWLEIPQLLKKNASARSFDI